MHRLYCLMGKSSSGKDKLYKTLLGEEELALRFVVPYTTRPIRTGEVEGVAYHFVNEEEYRKLSEAGKILEERAYQTVHGLWRYFTADDGQIDLEESDYLLIGTVEVFTALSAYFGKDKVVPLFVRVEEGERLARALERERKQAEPKYAEMCRRYLADEADFAPEKLAAAGITEDDMYDNPNGGLEGCAAKIAEKIRSGHS